MDNAYYGPKNPCAPQLSPREIEILCLLAEGMSSREIGGQLSLSVHTVNTHRRNMQAKSGSNNTSALIAWGFRCGLLLLDGPKANCLSEPPDSEKH